MQTIDKIFTCKHEVKKSTFIAFLVPFSEFEAMKIKLKNEHPKANHIVWAYRHLNEFGQIVENSSDDGEPKGTSGPPTLNVLRGADLVNCGVLIVRYFGGIKLGTGGLVRAYSGSCNEVIKNSNLLPYEKLTQINFEIPFSLIQRFEHFFNANSYPDGEREYNQNGAIWKMDMAKKQEDDFHEFAKEYEFLGLKIL